MATATVSPVIAEMAFKPEFIEAMVVLNNKKYEATFELKEVPSDVAFKLMQDATASVENFIEWARNHDGALAERLIAQYQEDITRKYNDLVWSYKYDNSLLLDFVAPDKGYAEKVARVYAREILKTYSLRYVYVKRK
jgi:hypothetical protein